MKKGFNVHIIKKQYKIKSKEKIISVTKNSDAALVGDEAILTANIATTWLVKDRKIGIEVAISHGASLIILDDGYQD